MARVTPCVRVCRIAADGLCEGCARTTAEIGMWSRIDDDQAREIMAGLARRRDATPTVNDPDSHAEKVIE